jgi:hypothetical protein
LGSSAENPGAATPIAAATATPDTNKRSDNFMVMMFSLSYVKSTC